MSLYPFPKTERLKSRKRIGQLFKQKQTIGAYPLRVFWIEVEEDMETVTQAAFSVPKRKFKRAVERNRIRRKIIEAYRLQKGELCQYLEQKDKKIAIVWLYVATDPPTYATVEKSMKKLLNRLKQAIETNEKSR
ncbi:MAG: ribonuclease P protein component [Aureispira sp.]|nr:ribonuclease P protein component [Aureispira sp.]